MGCEVTSMLWVPSTPQNRDVTRCSRRTGNGRFQKGGIRNPGGRPKLPAEMREMFQAKSQEALDVLIRCLQSGDDRVAMMAAQAILDRGYGKPMQSIDADVTEDGGSVRYYVEIPEKAQRRSNGWRASGGRAPSVRWSTASLLPSMTYVPIRRKQKPLPGSIERGKPASNRSYSKSVSGKTCRRFGRLSCVAWTDVPD